MSNFNPKYNNLTPTEWSHRALENSTDNNSSFLPIGGLVLGILAASTTGFPPTGLLIFAWAVYEAFKRNRSMGRNELAITQYGCVAHCLSADDFRDFRTQVGDEEVVSQLQWARNNNYRLSEIAEDYLDSIMRRHQEPDLLPIIDQNTKINATVVPVMPQAQFVVDAIVPESKDKKTELVEFKTETPNLPALLAQSLKLSLIVGVPGSGKGIFVSNALEAVKRYHPLTTVFYIDPKNDAKETAYFSGRVDKLFRLDLMTTTPMVAAQWVSNCLTEYDLFDCGNGRKLLVFDELNLTLKTLKGVKVDKGEQSPLEWLKMKLTGYSSSGDSRGIVLWGISQNAHVTGLGMDGGDRTMFIPIFIVDARNISASEGILKAQMIPSDKRLNSTQIQQLCKASSIGRAIYFGGNNEWYPMPKLENYSGFDRDSRKFLDGFAATPRGERLASDYNAIAKLEDSFKSQPPSSRERDDRESQQLSELATLVLSYFDSVIKKEAKSIRDLKQSTKLRGLSDLDLLTALHELVVAQELKFNIEGSYLKSDWS